ncbi:hypothetical protein IQ07DRAFT_241422 [Pyrenochaeta sp. DS3sAY3a]|nr:hypothetical protein IQ07DRAFT_241422 [Pyrenochaeta sp. DS3sAY3a]
MTDLSKFLTELRHLILEFLVEDVTSPLPLPDVDAINPSEWVHIECDHFDPNHLDYYIKRRVSNMKKLCPYLLINKTLKKDVIYIWEEVVSPRRKAVLSVTSVGQAMDRPARGLLLQWISLPSLLPALRRLEIHVRFFDHVEADGSEPLVVLLRNPTLVALYDLIDRINFVPDRAVALPDSFFPPLKNLKKVVFRLSTETAPNVHVFPLSEPHGQGSSWTFHPFLESESLARVILPSTSPRINPSRPPHFFKVKECEVWVDDALVRKARRVHSDDAAVEHEVFDYPLSEAHLDKNYKLLSCLYLQSKGAIARF